MVLSPVMAWGGVVWADDCNLPEALPGSQILVSWDQVEGAPVPRVSIVGWAVPVDLALTVHAAWDDGETSWSLADRALLADETIGVDVTLPTTRGPPAGRASTVYVEITASDPATGRVYHDERTALVRAAVIQDGLEAILSVSRLDAPALGSGVVLAEGEVLADVGPGVGGAP